MENIVYAGARLHQGKKTFYYLKAETSEMVQFTKHLCPNDFIGGVIQCEIVNDGRTFRNCTVVRGTEVGDPWQESVDLWFVQNRAAMETFNHLATGRQLNEDPIDELIREVKKHFFALDRKERMRIARYVFEELLS